MTRGHGKMGPMNSLPLVGAEVQRINAAFSTISGELAGVLASLRESDLGRVGTPNADPAVAAGMADLRAALTRLQATSDACTTALRRHGRLDEPQPTAPADATELTDPGPGDPV